MSSTLQRCSAGFVPSTSAAKRVPRGVSHLGASTASQPHSLLLRHSSSGSSSSSSSSSICKRRSRTVTSSSAPDKEAKPNSSGSGDDATSKKPTGVAALVGTPLYGVIELAELLVILMLIDAAFSGDWSRIEVISKETELALQKVVAIVVAGHSLTAIAAGVLASKKGRNPAVPALKGFLFGALGLYEEQQTP